MTKSLTEQQIRKIIENGTGKAAKVCEKKFYGKPKSLTEQYYDQILEDGFYYAKNKDMKNIFILEWNPWGQQYQDVEIISAVPSYEEWKELKEDRDYFEKKMFERNCDINKLEQQLEIATKALERIYQPAVGDIYNFETDELDHTKLQDIAYKALKEMEGVK